jgi:hypothetical protein
MLVKLQRRATLVFHFQQLQNREEGLFFQKTSFSAVGGFFSFSTVTEKKCIYLHTFSSARILGLIVFSESYKNAGGKHRRMEGTSALGMPTAY